MIIQETLNKIINNNNIKKMLIIKKVSLDIDQNNENNIRSKGDIVNIIGN